MVVKRTGHHSGKFSSCESLRALHLFTFVFCQEGLRREYFSLWWVVKNINGTLAIVLLYTDVFENPPNDSVKTFQPYFWEGFFFPSLDVFITSLLLQYLGLVQFYENAAYVDLMAANGGSRSKYASFDLTWMFWWFLNLPIISITFTLQTTIRFLIQLAWLTFGCCR